MGLNEQLMIMILVILGVWVTFYLSVYLGKGNVMASALVVLTAGIIEYIFPGILGRVEVAAIAAASYAGMVSYQRISTQQEIFIVGFLCGMIFIAADGFFAGIGGRLGTIAAVSWCSYFGYRGAIFSLAKLGQGWLRQKA